MGIHIGKSLRPCEKYIWLHQYDIIICNCLHSNLFFVIIQDKKI